MAVPEDERMSSTSVHVFLRETVDIDLFLRDATEGGYPRPDTFLGDALNPDDVPKTIVMNVDIRGTS